VKVVTTGAQSKRRYKRKDEVMRERIAKGLCDTCGGHTTTMRIAGKPVQVCANNGVCGFHEVGVRDGARFYQYRGAERALRS